MAQLLLYSLEQIFLYRRTTQSPYSLLFTHGAAPGLPFYTASAGHLMMLCDIMPTE